MIDKSRDADKSVDSLVEVGNDSLAETSSEEDSKCRTTKRIGGYTLTYDTISKALGEVPSG